MKALVIILSLLSTPALALDTAALDRIADSANFSLNNTCSATPVASDKLLTAAHCIESQYKTVEKDVVAPDGEVKKKKFRVAVPGEALRFYYDGAKRIRTVAYQYKVVASDKDRDIALVQLRETPIDGVIIPSVACTDPRRGDVAYTVGNPFGLYGSVAVGHISNVRRTYADLDITTSPADDGEHPLIQHTSPIAPGSSGGALYNDAGELIGVNVRGVRGFNLYFAVGTADVRAFLNKNGIKVCQ